MLELNNRKTFNYTQINTGNIKEVFPLLCPVMEREWIDGWDCNMIYTKSGYIEEDCVFTTTHHGNQETVWHVTHYNKENYTIEFLRITPHENTVRIKISLEKLNNLKTKTHTSYMYTLLNSSNTDREFKAIEKSFFDSMFWWEKAINYYLEKRELLEKEILKA
ncbi:MAG TPA: hypothetical protein VGA80_02830 [Flavobacteriaceae bacterium]|jgi:hypothetical protein